MKYADFHAEGFYYNYGRELVQPGMIMEAMVEGHPTYYKLVRENNTDEVYLVEAATHGVMEPTREFLHNCYPPLDPAKIPAFPN